MPHRRVLDELAANATLAPVTRLVDGWLAKSAPALPFRRCNAVVPPVAAGSDLARVDAAIDALEEWYGARGLRVVVQVSFGDAVAEALDEHLAERGYEVEAPVVVKVGSSADVLARCMAESRPGVEAELRVGVGDDWEDISDEVHGDDEAGRSRTAAFGRMLGPLGVGALAAVGRLDGEPVGVGFGVLERGHLGVFGLATGESSRRRGVATAMLGSLVAAAGEGGAPQTYLQVESGNAAARALFVGVGYSQSHRYHYRVSAPA